MMNIGVGGAWLPITPFVGVGGAWKSITGAWIGVGDAWKSLNATPLALLASPTSLYAFTQSSFPLFRPTITTGSVTVTPSGGVGPYTHAWTISFSPSGSIDTSGTCAVTSPTSATTTFSGKTCAGSYAPGSDNYVAIDTVTDTSSGATTTIAIPIQLANEYVA